jgi:flavin reductase (DIM6/NTAB) family NADH-FMN oxidoreductase RutF
MVIDTQVSDPSDLYQVLVSVVIPRPIAFVSSIDTEGTRNLAPFSFFTVASVNPPVVCFSPLRRRRDGRAKDTLRNICATGEFVINVVSEELGERMNLTSAEFPPEVDEFVQAGLTPSSSRLVCCPGVQESPVRMECQLIEVISLGDEPLAGNLILGRILLLDIRDEVVVDGVIGNIKLRAIGRMGGSSYVRTTDLFDLPRPTTLK